MAVDDDEELAIDDLDDFAMDDVASEAFTSEDDAEPAWGPSIAVNGTVYAVSLFWQPLQDTSDPFPEVQETVQNVMEGADLFCLRTGTSPQYGIGNSMEGHKAGMPSAAAAVAELFQDKASSVAVFEVDEGWWFIAVRNDLILSEEDILYLNEDDAKRAFYAMMAVPDWGRKVAPASWDVDGTEEIDLWDILKSSGSSKLVRIDRAARQKMRMIIGGAGAVVLYIGYKLIGGIFGPATPAVVRPIMPLKPLFEEEAPQQKVVEPKPWEQLVETEDLLNRCNAGVMQVKSMVIPGWELGAITCSASGLSTTWSMKWGHIGWLKRAFDEYGVRGLDYIIADSGTTAVVSLSIGTVAVHSDTPKFLTYEAREELNSIFQAIGMDIALSEERTKIYTKASRDGLRMETHQDRTYARLNFNFTSDLPIANWLPVFNRFPALEITNLNYNPLENMWTYEGQIYEPVI